MSARTPYSCTSARAQLLRFVGRALGDVILTRDEIDGLMANLLISKCPPTGRRRFSDWLSQHAATLGVRYSSELRTPYQ